MAMFWFFVVIIVAYLAGSINFSILLFHSLGKGDPRDGFSGNPGVFNVYRQAGLAWAVVVLALDILRSAGIAWLALGKVPPEYLPWCALFLIVGNLYPLFHGFCGGKGVANYLGFTVVAAPWAAALAAAVWVAVYGIRQEAFLGSFGMIAVLSFGLAWRSGYHPLAVLGATVVTGLIIIAHRSNIARMISGKGTDTKE